MKKVVIIGGGVSGLTCAIYLSRFGHDVTVFNNASYGSLAETPLVENFPGFPDGISGLDLLTKMEEQAEKFGTKIEFDKIIEIEQRENRILSEYFVPEIKYDALVIATGMTSNRLEDFSDGTFKNNIHYCATCDGNSYKDENVIVVGGGDSAITEAIYLSNICKKVTIVHRRNEFRASKILVEKFKTISNISTKMEKEIIRLYGVNNCLTEVELTDGTIINASGIFVSIGRKPNDELFKHFKKLKENVFLCGDCVENKYRQAIVAAGEGAKTAIDVNDYLMNH